MPNETVAYNSNKALNFGLKTLSVLFGISALASINIAKREYIASRAETAWTVQDYLLASIPEQKIAFSTASDRYFVTGCLRVVSTVNGRLLGGESRAQLLENCGGLVQNITATSPLNAYAWFAQAYLAAQQNNVTGAVQALHTSYQTGQTEQWIAELRVALAEVILADMPPQTYAGHLSDLALLVQSQRGIGSIARRYVANPEFRVRITSVVEALSEPDQIRFLRVLNIEVVRAGNEE